MREENVDLRPFKGVPFVPSNTFATTMAPSRKTGTLSAKMSSFPAAAPAMATQPASAFPSMPATARPLSLATVLASR
jgi:hypothetical protein